MKMVQCLKSELDLFSPLPVQRDIIKTETIVINSISNLMSPSLEFLIPGTECYKDLNNVYIRLLVEMTAPETGDTKVAESGNTVVNNIAHSLFRQVTIYLNNTIVSGGEANYGYRTYLEKLLNYSTEAASTFMKTSGWYLDSGKIDSIIATENPGLNQRCEWLTNKKKVEIFARVHADIFNQNRYLLSNIDLCINMVKEKPEFYMMGADSNKCDLKILEANILIDQCYVNPSLIMAHEKLLDSNKFITYPYKRLQLRHYAIPTNQHTLCIESAVMGLIPNLLLFAMVSSDAFQGKRSSNPFNFQHFDINSIQLNVNGQCVPSRPLEMNFEKNSGRYAHAYYMLFKNLQLIRADKANMITIRFHNFRV